MRSCTCGGSNAPMGASQNMLRVILLPVEACSEQAGRTHDAKNRCKQLKDSATLGSTYGYKLHSPTRPTIFSV